jgi:hypothetical protein
MAEKTLVTQEDLADGARLIQELEQASFPISAAFWAYDALLETWRLIIAAPRGAIESLVAAYGIIQSIISEKDLGVTLDRISLIPDDDVKLGNLQALARSDAQDVVEVSVGRTEIAGRVLDDIHLYKNDALRYELDVIRALQRVQPSDAVMRTYRNSDLPPGLQADALLDDGERLVFVEIKAYRRPLATRDVFQVEGMLHAYERNFGRYVAAMIVSRSGFTPSAVEAAQSPRMVLVQWTGSEDDEKLRDALAEARARGKA